MSIEPHQMELGESLRDRGIEQVSENNSAWMDTAELVLMDVAREKSRFTADDLRDALSLHNQPPNPNAIGALFKRAANKRLIRKTGNYLQARNASRHAAIVAEWELMT